MTEKIYYQDAYTKHFSAVIREVKQDGQSLRICLDRTAFYPEGGGQGADTGVLALPDGTVLKVTDVQETEGEIWHTVTAGVMEDGLTSDAPGISCLPEEGTLAEGTIDWARRFDHMQQHSGEHIVSGMICKRFACDNVGFHMGTDLITIDYNAPISFEQALEIEQQANAYIWEDHPLEVLWPSKEELGSLVFRSKKELDGDARITRFPGADTCACCGTHVSSSAQVGLVKFLSAKKFHDGTRLELLCGKRAMDYLTMNHTVNKAAAMLLSTSEENTEDRVKKLLEENIRLKTAGAELEDRCFQLWARQFAGEKTAFVIDDALSQVQGRKLADMIADQCAGLTAVFTKTDAGYRYAVINRTEDITELIKKMNEMLSGRGGGRNGFAQGSVSAGRKEIEAYFQSLR